MFSSPLKILLVCTLSAGALALPTSVNNNPIDNGTISAQSVLDGLKDLANAIDNGTISTRSDLNTLEKRDIGSIAWFGSGRRCTKGAPNSTSDIVSNTITNTWDCLNVAELKATFFLPDDAWRLGWDWGTGGNKEKAAAVVHLYSDVFCKKFIASWAHKDQKDNPDEEMDFCLGNKADYSVGSVLFQHDDDPTPTTAPRDILDDRNDAGKAALYPRISSPEAELMIDRRQSDNYFTSDMNASGGFANSDPTSTPDCSASNEHSPTSCFDKQVGRPTAPKEIRDENNYAGNAAAASPGNSQFCDPHQPPSVYEACTKKVMEDLEPGKTVTPIS